jgi:hypothetical protein
VKIVINAKSHYVSSDGKLDAIFVAARKLVIDADTANMARGTQTVTSLIKIMKHDGVGKQPYVGIVNRGTTNTVNVARGGSTSMLKLNPGEVALFRAYNQVWVSTDSGTSQIEFFACGTN